MCATSILKLICKYTKLICMGNVFIKFISHLCLCRNNACFVSTSETIVLQTDAIGRSLVSKTTSNSYLEYQFIRKECSRYKSKPEKKLGKKISKKSLVTNRLVKCN